MSRLSLVQALASFAVGATGRHARGPRGAASPLAAGGFAWLIGAIGVGALLGPLIPNAAGPDYRDARWLFVPYVIRGMGDVLLAIVTSLPTRVLILLFVYGLNTSTGMVVFNSTVQRRVPDRVRGRVFTLLDITWNAMRLLSLGLGGVLVDLVGIQAVFWTGGRCWPLQDCWASGFWAGLRSRQSVPDKPGCPTTARWNESSRAVDRRDWHVRFSARHSAYQPETRSTMPALKRSVRSISKPSARTRSRGRRSMCSPSRRSVICSSSRWRSRHSRTVEGTWSSRSSRPPGRRTRFISATALRSSGDIA